MTAGRKSDPGVPKTLRDLLQQEELSDVRAMELALSLAEALVQAHRRGRFFVQLTDRKVLVFDGDEVQVAGLESGQTGRRPEGRPAPRYMAPEQWRGEEAAAAAQVWALGLLLHQMIAGRHPHDQITDDDALRDEVTGEEPVPLDPSFDEVAPRLSELVAACLQKDPEQRPPARKVVKILEELLSTCRPADPSARERERRRSLRRLEQLEQQQVKPRRTVLGMLVGAMVVFILSLVHYRGLFWGKKGTGNGELGTRNSELGTGNSERETENGELGTRNSEQGTGSGTGVPQRAPLPQDPDAGAGDQRPAPAKPAPTAPPINKTDELYPTSTPEPATKPLPMPVKRR